MKQIYKKWWFWLIIIIIIGSIIGGGTQQESKMYITNYEWNLKDTKTENDYKYIVLGVENQEKDLETGTYIFKTNNNSQASFMIFVTNEYYEKISEIPETYDFDMVQGIDNSEIEITLNKGQFVYLCQNQNGQGEIYVDKK